MLIKSKFFERSVPFCLFPGCEVETLLPQFVIENVSLADPRKFAEVLWEQDSFRRNVAGSVQFFVLSRGLLDKFPSLAVMFVAQRHHIHTFRNVSKTLTAEVDELSAIVASQLECFATSVRSFTLDKADKKRYSDFVASLEEIRDRIPPVVSRIFNSNTPNDVCLALSHIVSVLFSISDSYRTMMAQILDGHNLFNDIAYLEPAKELFECYACCLESEESWNFITTQFLDLKKINPIVVDTFAVAITRQAEDHNLTDIAKKLHEILNDASMFTVAVRKLSSMCPNLGDLFSNCCRALAAIQTSDINLKGFKCGLEFVLEHKDLLSDNPLVLDPQVVQTVRTSCTELKDPSSLDILHLLDLLCL